MPELGFEVLGARAVPFCAAPTLALALGVANAKGDRVEAIALECQLRIEAQRRRYEHEEKQRLVELFGEPSRWAQTLRSLLWTHAAVNVPPFETNVEVDLHVPCTADFTMLAGKYFSALEVDGGVPISLLFSGSVFYAAGDGCLQVTRIPWSAETVFELPVAAWRDLIETYYPNTAWLTLRRDTFDRLYAFRTAHGLPTWEETLEELLRAADQEAPR